MKTLNFLKFLSMHSICELPESLLRALLVIGRDGGIDIDDDIRAEIESELLCRLVESAVIVERA